jgi:hypothetical protein
MLFDIFLHGCTVSRYAILISYDQNLIRILGAKICSAVHSIKFLVKSKKTLSFQQDMFFTSHKKLLKFFKTKRSDSLKFLVIFEKC